MLLLATAGHGEHFLDFTRLRCRAGTVFHVRPGQVQQFVLGQTLEANVLLFTPEFILPAASALGVGYVGSLIDDVAPEGVIQLRSTAFETIGWSFAAIEREYRATDASPLTARILQHLLYALLLSIARETSHSSPSSPTNAYVLAFRKFSKAVEAQFTRTRAVEDYARRWMLGQVSAACLPSRA